MLQLIAQTSEQLVLALPKKGAFHSLYPNLTFLSAGCVA